MKKWKRLSFLQRTKATTAYGERRISDEMLEIIADFEGYSKGVYADSLAYGIPTTGYGYVISKASSSITI